MLHISYKLDISKYHGIGLFAGEDLPKGTLIYTPSPLLDVNLTQEQFDSLADSEKREVQWWGFFDEPSQKWHVDFDVTHFINHSYDANITQNLEHKDAYLIATRDIKKGEELTQNYLEFESEKDLKRRSIPSK
jgi:SET domain-containing protein